MDKEVIIKQRQQKQFLLVLLGIIMVAGSIFIFSSDLALFGVYGVNKIIGLIGIIFFGFCLFFITKRFITPQDILIVDRNGITDNSSAISIGFIPWEDVKASYITSVFTQTFITIYKKTPTSKLHISRKRGRRWVMNCQGVQ